MDTGMVATRRVITCNGHMRAIPSCDNVRGDVLRGQPGGVRSDGPRSITAIRSWFSHVIGQATRVIGAASRRYASSDLDGIIAASVVAVAASAHELAASAAVVEKFTCMAE